MLYLKSERDGSLFHLLPGKTFKINRKEGDLVLADDLSISRSHSALLVSQKGEILLWDEGSKYGTHILHEDSEQKLPKNEKTKIKVGDRIRFGVQWNIYSLCKTDVVVCTSTITAEDKKILQQILQKLGGRLKSNWDDTCTHLTMNRVSLTHKVVFALADGKPIVTLGFWQKMEEAVTNHLELPKIEDYQPPIEEEELQKQTKSDTLLPSNNRKTLFRGKIFVFSTEESKNKLKPLVDCAGGVCKSIQSSKLTAKQCCESNYIVIKDGDASQHATNNIGSVLKKNGLRGIDISEIGLAIYNNSVDRYCNPSWSKPVILGRSPSQSQGICLVENTEDIVRNTQDIKGTPGSKIVIPQSLSSVESDISLDSSRTLKRPPSPTDNRPAKRLNQQKKPGSLENWLQRSDTKESEATVSFDISGENPVAPKSRKNKSALPEDNDPFKIPSPKKTNGFKKGRAQEDDDSFKVPSPKKTNGLRKGRAQEDDEDLFKVPSPKKRGRAETDPFELPPPKKAAPVDKSLDPFEETIEDHSDEELEVSRSSRKRAVAAPTIEDDSDEEFKVPPPRKRNAGRILDEDEPPRKASVAKNTVPEARPSTSRQAEGTSMRRVEPSVINGPVRASSNESTSNLSETTKKIPTPSIAEFIDKSVGVEVKKEEQMDEKAEEELSKYLNKINIVETSLFRQRPAQRAEKNSSTASDGRPNFKRFKKATQRIHRRIIDLVVDQDMRLYDGVPEPDPDVPTENRPERREPEPESSEELFPSTSRRVPENRPNRRNRQQSQIVDEWTV